MPFKWLWRLEEHNPGERQELISKKYQATCVNGLPSLKVPLLETWKAICSIINIVLETTSTLKKMDASSRLAMGEALIFDR